MSRRRAPFTIRNSSLMNVISAFMRRYCHLVRRLSSPVNLTDYPKETHQPDYAEATGNTTHWENREPTSSRRGSLTIYPTRPIGAEGRQARYFGAVAHAQRAVYFLHALQLQAREER